MMPNIHSVAPLPELIFGQPVALLNKLLYPPSSASSFNVGAFQVSLEEYFQQVFSRFPVVLLYRFCVHMMSTLGKDVLFRFCSCLGL
jgi:hypothetical protein